MSNRTIRVNELIRQELNAILRSDYGVEAVAITITDVEVAPNLRSALIFYSVIGGAPAIASAKSFLSKKAREMRQSLNRRITIKYSPELRFVYDASMERGSKILSVLDELEHEQPD
ncbi:MAG: ribosome-binding factor A [Verrucomicrobia bacterium 21-51-4]|nr:MAG: ribosome-binding factor A [Verrucomicrobia bacterium 21-51-4]HQU09018.1 30S ribosome-binding factor RbfA [Opitutales bacterium]